MCVMLAARFRIKSRWNKCFTFKFCSHRSLFTLYSCIASFHHIFRWGCFCCRPRYSCRLQCLSSCNKIVNFISALLNRKEARYDGTFVYKLQITSGFWTMFNAWSKWIFTRKYGQCVLEFGTNASIFVRAQVQLCRKYISLLPLPPIISMTKDNKSGAPFRVRHLSLTINFIQSWERLKSTIVFVPH